MKNERFEAPAVLAVKGWAANGANIINGNEVKFFKHPDLPKIILKWYTGKNGFMLSSDFKNRNSRRGKTDVVIPFTGPEKLEDVLSTLK